MSEISILNQCLNIKKNKAITHFAVCNSNKIRYLVDINGGKKHLAKNISTYSNKLNLVMMLLKFIPLKLLEVLKLGYFVNVEVDSEIKKIYEELGIKNWNVIVGTYDKKQKLVFQCYKKNDLALFVKVGNINTAKEMAAEIDYLQKSPNYTTFSVPKLILNKTIKENSKFNIQVTQEFKGEKVETALNDYIYKIYRELSDDISDINGIKTTFSHGDFAPWNIKKENGQYIVFDWEHSDKRFLGFDLIHYTYMVERLLNKKEVNEAVKIAVEKAKSYDERLKDFKNQELCDLYIKNVKITLGHE